MGWVVGVYASCCAMGKRVADTQLTKDGASDDSGPDDAREPPRAQHHHQHHQQQRPEVCIVKGKERETDGETE